MDPVQKALWYVESHSQDELTLDAIANACHVSAFHLTRGFAATMGVSLMRYVRGRRLSEAARQLAAGAPEILTVALVAGYGSHEAFTRAFRDQFSCTPEQVRAHGLCNSFQLVEPMLMNSQPVPDLAPPRFALLKPFRVAGLVERYNCESSAGIPSQWQRFGPHLGNLPGQIGNVAYGVCFNFDEESDFDYMCGVEIAEGAPLPAGIASLRIAAQNYAVFHHAGHVAGIRAAFSAIWGKWLPESGRQIANAPFLERYGPEFQPRTGLGGFEIWIPLQE